MIAGGLDSSSPGARRCLAALEARRAPFEIRADDARNAPVPGAAPLPGVADLEDQDAIVAEQNRGLILHDQQLDAIDALVEQIAGHATRAQKAPLEIGRAHV